MAETYCIILTTTGSLEEAARLAELLVSHRLAACVQFFPITSCYHWQGKIQKESEYLLFVKTAAQLYSDVEKTILENHSYEIPEIIQIPIDRGLELYLGWMDESLHHAEI
mgnify:CR=1 FL=1